MLKKRGDDAGSGKGDNHLIPVEIHGLCPVADPDKLGQLMETFLVLLRDDGDRVVPITIGQFEGQVRFKIVIVNIVVELFSCLYFPYMKIIIEINGPLI